jgi:hypothetical protein
MKKHFWIILILFVAGCMACAHTGGMSKPASYSFTIDIPEGWRKIDNNRYLFVTKESPFLQYIMVQNRPIGKSFRNTKKKIQKEMLPEEAAQIIIDELISDQNLVNLRVLDNSPATQTYKTLYYGFLKEDTFFNLRFTAEGQIYFQRDISDFRSVLNTFQIFKKETA